MDDNDGGQSLIAAGIRAVTSADAKQDQLQKELVEVQNRLLQISRGWAVDPNANLDREKRLAAAKRVLDWLASDEEAVYCRVAALQESLCVAEGEEMQIADCGDAQGRRRGEALPRQLRAFLQEWASVAVPKRFEACCGGRQQGAPWLDPNDVHAFVRYLRDYLCTEKAFGDLVGALQPVVNLKTRDEAARRRARRKYVRIILNDYILNPGPSQAPLPLDDAAAGSAFAADHDFSRFGPMAPLLERWAKRLPQALALGAGEHVRSRRETAS